MEYRVYIEEKKELSNVIHKKIYNEKWKDNNKFKLAMLLALSKKLTKKDHVTFLPINRLLYLYSNMDTLIGTFEFSIYLKRIEHHNKAVTSENLNEFFDKCRDLNKKVKITEYKCRYDEVIDWLSRVTTQKYDNIGDINKVKSKVRQYLGKYYTTCFYNHINGHREFTNSYASFSRLIWSLIKSNTISTNEEFAVTVLLEYLSPDSNVFKTEEIKDKPDEVKSVFGGYTITCPEGHDQYYVLVKADNYPEILKNLTYGYQNGNQKDNEFFNEIFSELVDLTRFFVVTQSPDCPTALESLKQI